MIPSWLLVLTHAVMWLSGFLACGAFFGTSPFWSGVRRVFTGGASK